MSSTLLLTATPVTMPKESRATPKESRATRRKRPFDRRAKNDLRRLLDALREIGDRPDLEQILRRYEVTEAKLTAFVKEVEADALVIESRCQ